MKIIIANYRYYIAGGPEKYMFKFMDSAKARGIEVIPFSVSNPKNEETPYSKYFAKPRSKEIMYADTKFSISNMIGTIRATIWNYDAAKRIRKLIRDTKPDVVYVLHEVNHLSPAIVRAAKKEGVPVIHRISDFFMFCAKYDFLYKTHICEECLSGKYMSALKKKCVKGSTFGTLLRVMGMYIHKFSGVFDDVDHYICTCEFSKGKLIQGGIPEEKISFIPTFIEARGIEPCYEHDKYFLFLGRMAHQKGAIYAIEAMNKMKNTDYKLKITGTISNSDDDQAIWKYVVENNLQDKVEFVGFQRGESLENLIKSATCIVCPAIWYENMPNTVIEAYAYGKPVIASRLGSLAEIVVDNETGMLFEPKNSDELAEKFMMFVNDNELSGKLGKQARLKCEKDYSEEMHMTKVLECMNKYI